MGKLAIIGLGLIGGSMGLALRRAEPVNTEVTGYDRDLDVGIRAHRFGAIDRLAQSSQDAVRDATMVIIATPITSVRRVMEEISPHLKPGCVVTDTASTKSDVMRWARDTLPRNVYFVGGHPMAGKEQSGNEAAEESLFDDRPYVVIPAVDAVQGAVNAVLNLATAVGAKPFFLDADEHDAYAAAISHVPLVASIALFSLARGSNAWPELAGMAGPAFRDLTRLASGSPEMAQDICMTNKDHILHWLDRYITEVYRLRDLIDTNDPETLFRSLAEAQLEREEFILNPPERKPVVPAPTDMPSPVDALLGSLALSRARELTGDLEKRQKERAREDRLRRRE